MGEILKTDFLGNLRVRLDPQYSMEKAVLDNQVWEPHVAYLISQLVHPGYICADIGANVGLHTLAMASMTQSSGEVYAFEPSNLCYPRLEANVRLNPLLSTIIHCAKLGVSERKGKLKLFQSGDGSNAYLAEEYDPKLSTRGDPTDFETCDVVSLDDYFAGKRLDFMKVDVEGMELDVFLGALRTLKEHTPTIIFETLIDNFDKLRIQASEELLRSVGYLLFALVRDQNYVVPVTFPKLPYDSVAIHREKLSAVDKLIAPFSNYKARLVIGNDNAESIELTIVDLPQKTIYAKFQQNTQVVVLSAPVVISANSSTIQTDESVKDWKCILRFTDSSLEEFTGRISVAANNWDIEGIRSITAGSYPGLP